MRLENVGFIVVFNSLMTLTDRTADNKGRNENDDIKKLHK